MTASDPTPDPCRFSMRLRRIVLGGWVVAGLSLPAAVSADPADVVAEKKAHRRVLLFKPPVEIWRARFQYASANKFLDPVTTHAFFENCLRQKIVIVDQVCGLTDTQKQKLMLAGHGDIKRGYDHAMELETHFQLVQNDVKKVNELCQDALWIRCGLIVLSGDDSLFAKVLEKSLTAEQSARYQPLRDVYRMGGRARINESSSAEGLLIILDDTAFGGRGFMRLTVVPNLQSLSLSGTQVTDAGLAHLKELPSLERLNLRDTQITDAGLARLGGMAKLESLDLQKTQVTDAGSSALKELAGLRDKVI